MVRAYLFYAVIIYDSSSHTCLPAPLPSPSLLPSSVCTLLVGLSPFAPHRSLRTARPPARVSAARGSFGILMRKRSSNALCLLYFLMNDAYRGSVYVIIKYNGGARRRTRSSRCERLKSSLPRRTRALFDFRAELICSPLFITRSSLYGTLLNIANWYDVTIMETRHCITR